MSIKVGGQEFAVQNDAGGHVHGAAPLVHRSYLKSQNLGVLERAVAGQHDPPPPHFFRSREAPGKKSQTNRRAAARQRLRKSMYFSSRTSNR